MATQKIRVQILNPETNEVIDECDIVTSSDAVLFPNGKTLTETISTITQSIADAQTPKLLTSVEDLNDVIENGVYIQSANKWSTTDHHYPIGFAGKLTVTTNDPEAFVFQTYQQYNTPTLWMRCKYLKTWYEWDVPLDRISRTGAEDITAKNITLSNDITARNTVYTKTLRLIHTGIDGAERYWEIMSIPLSNRYGSLAYIAPGQSLILHGGDYQQPLVDDIGIDPEHLYLCSDHDIYFYTKMQNGYPNNKKAVLNGNGDLYLGGDATKIAYHAGNLTKTVVNNILAGADYAEMFQWKDPDVYVRDQYGKFVTLDGDKLELANEGSDYILGVVSSTESASVIGDPSHIDEFGWDPVGIAGKLIVIDDGTCVVNGYCKPSVDGIGTFSAEKTDYRVMERINNDHIRIMIK